MNDFKYLNCLLNNEYIYLIYMSDIPKVIGQGTYGCVLKPSLKCENKPDQNYDNKVSKILWRGDAKKEIGEYKKVDKADKDKEFYLGKPDICELDKLTGVNRIAVDSCKIGRDVLAKLNNYNLIVMEDGGDNLLNYGKKIAKWSKSEMSTELCEKFLLETLRLFSGLVHFEKHGLVHHDLKPENIVYNELKTRLNFIDFGLMASRKKILTDANASKYRWNIFHWSFPWELQILNSNYFKIVNPQTLLNSVKTGILSKDSANKYHVNSDYFFYYVYNKHPNIPYNDLCIKYVDDFELTLKTDMINMGYEKFLDKSVRTIDVFGTGIALKSWLNCAYKYLDPLQFMQLDLLFNNMISGRLSTRLLPEDALHAYETFLIGSGLLEKYNKEIDDHMIVDAGEKRKVKLDNKPLKIGKPIKPPPGFGHLDPAPCPPGKELNPKTGKCVKAKPIKNAYEPCPLGKERNPATGRCIKIKQNKTIKKREEEPCPNGKERNPKTRRCINNCKPGYVRGSEFKCVREKK